MFQKLTAFERVTIVSVGHTNKKIDSMLAPLRSSVVMRATRSAEELSDKFAIYIAQLITDSKFSPGVITLCCVRLHVHALFVFVFDAFVHTLREL